MFQNSKVYTEGVGKKVAERSDERENQKTEHLTVGTIQAGHWIQLGICDIAT